MSVGRWIVVRRLRGVSRRLVAARDDLRVVSEQAAVLTDEADDLDVRALVSESPAARVEAREAGGHRSALQREVERLRTEIDRLTAEQDRLLDRLGGH
ncbi:MAG: hypothetical protein ACO3C1_06685 [Ilumatobacteraceae bacterium]